MNYPLEDCMQAHEPESIAVASHVEIAESAVFLRMTAVIQLTGLCRSTIYRLVAQDKFPSPVRIANRAIAWRKMDVERWSVGRPSVAH